MIEITDKFKCTGCEACVNYCPKDAISMLCDKEGFNYPYINKDKCINCNKCSRICPVEKFEENIEQTNKTCIIKRAFAVQNKNEDIRLKSSSGGTFYALASQFIQSGGIVAGASFDERFNVVHTIAYTIQDLEALIGSKYVQSKIGRIYSDIKELLDYNKKVLFTGMTCHIEGLKSYLGKDYSELYCIDLICMGVPSPGVWKTYLKAFHKNKKIANINFKDKRLGWHKFSINIEFQDGTNYCQPGFDNYYMEAMFKGYSLRPACFECKFKNEIKLSDISIADCWGCEKYIPHLDDNKGLSMVIAHTNRGMQLINSLSASTLIHEFDYNNAIAGNPNYFKTAEPINYLKRALFYFLLNIGSAKIGFKILCRNPQKSFVQKVKRKLRR